MASVQGDHSVVQRDEQIQKAWRLSKVITVWCKEMNKYRKHGVCPRRSASDHQNAQNQAEYVLSWKEWSFAWM